MRGRAYCCVCFLVLALAPIAHAQGDAFPWDPRSGDAWIDRQLADINLYAERYPDAYLDELVRYRAAPRALATRLLREGRWAPGDVYYACALAQMTVRPCAEVADAWRRDHALGWQAVASALGMPAASVDMRRIKQGVVDSYARWSRPIEPDATVARARATSR